MLNNYLRQCCLLLIPDADVTISDMHTVTASLDVEKRVLTNNRETEKNWKMLNYQVQYTELQDSQIFNLGLQQAFDVGFRKIIILTSVPTGLLTAHLTEAFLSLRILEICMGPLKDGGLYLLGMNAHLPEVVYQAFHEHSLSWKSFQKAAGNMKAAMYKLPAF